MTQKNPLARLNYSEDLTPIINRLCIYYEIGNLVKFSIIETGYEDCNVIIETEKEKYVAKIFSKVRSKQDILRYVSIMENVIKAGVSHPQLIKNKTNNFLYTDKEADGLCLVLMKFIDGKSFFELSQTPNKEELKLIIKQAVKISNINYKPSYLFDSWAIPNIKIVFEKVKKFISTEDSKLIEQVIFKYAEIPVATLPHCFVHGDLTKANVMKSSDKRVYILDFSVANWYPRIQEIAVIVANLLYDNSSNKTLQERIDLFLVEYEKTNPLTMEEKKYLYPYALAGIAMEFLGAYQEKYLNGNDSDETDFWLALGRDSLRKELCEFLIS